MPATMTQNPNKWIRGYQLRPPVDVKKIADDLRLQVWELVNMGPGISGKLFRSTSPSGFSIAVNANDSYTRKRFTIAHELAHFLLHRAEIQDGVVDDAFYRSEYLSGAQETEANKFAADILMPFHLLESMAQRGITNVDELARKFGVSTQAMSIRLGIPLP